LPAASPVPAAFAGAAGLLQFFELSSAIRRSPSAGTRRHRAVIIGGGHLSAAAGPSGQRGRATIMTVNSDRLLVKGARTGCAIVTGASSWPPWRSIGCAQHVVEADLGRPLRACVHNVLQSHVASSTSSPRFPTSAERNAGNRCQCIRTPDYPAVRSGSRPTRHRGPRFTFHASGRGNEICAEGIRAFASARPFGGRWRTSRHGDIRRLLANLSPATSHPAGSCRKRRHPISRWAAMSTPSGILYAKVRGIPSGSCSST